MPHIIKNNIMKNKLQQHSNLKVKNSNKTTNNAAYYDKNNKFL